LAYEARLIDELFDFSGFTLELRRLTDIIESKLYKLYPQLAGKMRQAERTIDVELKEVSRRFRLQYTALLSSGDREKLCERLRKACAYYYTRFHEVVASIIGFTKVDSDSEAVSSKIAETRSALISQLYVKLRLLKHFSENDFSVTEFLHTKAMAVVEEPSFSTDKQKKTSAKKSQGSQSARAAKSGGGRSVRKRDAESGATDGDIANPALFAQLRQWRKETAEARKLPVYMVANQRTLAEIAATLPTSEGELLAISGMSKAKIQLYGRDILRLVQAYLDASDDL